MNYFAHTTAAERYAKGRPYFHPIVIEKVKGFLGLETPLSHALDVACGTGQSTRALATIADHVTGIDSSEEMLAFAKQENTASPVTFLQSPAEVLPFDDNTFDLITVSLAFHWFERGKFLSEASRVLKSNGWLIVYDNNFAAIMKENSDFEPFFHEAYPARYPPPARNNQPITKENLEPFGFIKVSSESYSNEVTFTVASLVNYLMTHSNVITKVEQGTESSEEAQRWLTKLITKFLPNGQGTFTFQGGIVYMQKEAR